MITPSYPSKFPIPEIFWKTESPLTEILGTVRKTTFDKIVIHHLMQVFWSWNFLKQKSPPTIFFGTVRQKSFERKSCYPPLAIKIFDKRTFLKTKGIPYEVFWYCEKINIRQNRDTTSYAIYLMRKFSEKKGPPRSFLCSVRQRSFERKSWYPPTSHKNFR